MRRNVDALRRPPIWVLLRGLSRSVAHWGDFPQRLCERGLGEVICLDLPGNGSLHELPSPTCIATTLADVRARLANALPQGDAPHAPVHLLALSMGGMLACEWAQRWPQDLASLVLINSSLRGVSPLHQRLRPSAWVALLPLLLMPASAQRWETTLHALTSARTATRASVVADWVELRQRQPVSRLNALRQLLSAARYTAPALAPEPPVLVLGSAGDRLVNPRCSRALARRWDATLQIHPDAGHDLPLDDPQWLLDRLADWLDSLNVRLVDSQAARPEPPT
ncbi:MAG: hypothetical protein RIQ60_2644 [Pseudomonadota bacterium]|jgi:alpha-beta hydrolase superfamily lysophospholipase